MILVAAVLAALALALFDARSWLSEWLSGKALDQLYATLHDAVWLVIFGVVIEEWKLLKHFSTFIRYSFTGKFREAVTKAWNHKGEIVESVGFSILVIGLAGELAIAPLIETLQKTELQTQKQQTADALKEAGRLGVDVNNLHIFVDQKENGITKQLGNFQRFAVEEKKNSSAIIASLSAKQKEVVATINAAKKDESTLQASAATILNLRQKIHALTTDRVLTKQQSKHLTVAAKSLRPINFDESATLTDEAWTFASQIGFALQAAGWKWLPRHTFPGLQRKGVPAIGDDPREGLILEACKSDAAKFNMAAKLIENELLKDGFSFKGSLYKDKDAAFKNEPCGRLHIIVGSRY